MAGGAITDDRDDDPPTQAMPTPGSGAGGGWLLAGRYRVAERIGTGGMAEVFRAHDELLARDVAVKVFRTHADPADSAAGAQRQEIELQALAQLSHPNLITLFDGSIAPTTGPAFLVMELIQGPSLAAQLAEAPLTDAQARETGAQIADALAYVHSRSMVHRDIKPANILLGTDSTTGDATVRARLSDFGIVRLLGSDHLTSVNFMVGTASYLAPEQARGSEVGPPADVYSLGLVLIEAMTGQRSYPGPAMEAVMARLDHPPEIPATLAAPWPDLLRAMTDLDPARRPSAAAVVRALATGVSPAAIAEAPTAFVGAPVLAPLAADDATRTTALPVSPLADLPRVPDATPARTGYVGWLVAAVIAVVAVAAVAFVLISKGSSNDSPTTPVAPVSSSAPATTSDTPTESDTPSDTTSDTEPTTTDETTTAATTPAPTTSATSSSPAPTTSASTSAAPSTTAATSATPTKSATTTAEGAGKTTSTSSSASATVSPTTTTTTSAANGAAPAVADGEN